MVNNKFWRNWTIASKISTVISMGVVTSILVIAIGAVTFLKKEYLSTFGKQQFTTVQAFAMYLDDNLSKAARRQTPRTASDGLFSTPSRGTMVPGCQSSYG
ncbi:MAG: hypothetical protein K0A99_00310 [Desulfoarculaceae bacterium]|nr:hypothetical protein [Desulfoarculaceae bacterium]